MVPGLLLKLLNCVVYLLHQSPELSLIVSARCPPVLGHLDEVGDDLLADRLWIRHVDVIVQVGRESLRKWGSTVHSIVESWTGESGPIASHAGKTH